MKPYACLPQSSLAKVSLVKANAQQGWVTLELMLALVLLSVVLYVVQQQAAGQWQALQQAELARQLNDSQIKQAKMATLTGSQAWLDPASYSSNQGQYPDCQPCTGAELFQWLQASQQVSAVETDDLGGANE